MRSVKLKFIIAGLLVLGLAVSQTSTERAYVWTLSGTSMQLREITGMTWNAATRTWSIPVAAPAQQYSFGSGFITATPNGSTVTQVSLDTAYVMYRGSAPTAPGACALTNGTGVMALDAGYLYVCSPNPAQAGTFRWGRAPMEFTW